MEKIEIFFHGRKSSNTWHGSTGILVNCVSIDEKFGKYKIF